LALADEILEQGRQLVLLREARAKRERRPLRSPAISERND
jgi:hypothetical protein